MSSPASLLQELRDGEYKRTGRERGELLVLETYKTKSGTKVQVWTTIFGVLIEVNGIEQSKFMAWRIRRAMRKGSYAK